MSPIWMQQDLQNWPYLMRNSFRFFSFALFLTLCLSANAANVVIVRTSDAEPYTQAQAGLVQQLADPKYLVTTMTAREVSDKGVETSIGKADVVVAVGTAAARWLHKQLPADVKLAYCMVSNPSGATLLQGHACVGVTTDVAVADQFKLVAELLPHARSIGLLYRSDTPEGKASLADLKSALPPGWNVHAVAANDYSSIADAINFLMQKQIDIAWTIPDPKLWTDGCVRTLLTTAVRSKVPVWGYSPPLVRAGALLGVGLEPAVQGRQAGQLVIQTLNDPADFKTRVIQPDSFPIAVNLTVGEQIGVEIPEAFSHKAKFVYPEK